MKNKKELETQVLIIGGGITGTTIARELFKYKVDAMVIEKDLDVASGQTKSSSTMVYSTQGIVLLDPGHWLLRA